MNKNKFTIALVFLTAFVLRFALITIAHHGDLNNNISWGTLAYEMGFDNFYEGDGLLLRENDEPAWPYSAPNQPPLTIEMFALARLVWQKLKDFFWYMNWTLLIFPSKLVWFWDEKGMDVLVKLPSIIADLGIGWLIYSFVTKVAKKSQKVGLTLLAVWLFNPLTWYNSAVWGQTDSVVNFLGLSSLYFLLMKKLPLSGILFALSMLFKGSLSIFVPVLFLVALAQRYPLSVWIKTIFCSLLTVTLVSVWFHPNWDLFIWLFKLYKERILPGEIGFLTANSFNFWWLINSGKVLDNTVYFGLTARTWGFIFSTVGLVIALRWLHTKVEPKRIFFALALSSLITFLFLTRIHERYLYPFFPLATIYMSLVPSFWPIYAVLSLTYLINLFNLFWVPTLPALRELLSTTKFTDVLAYLNLTMLFLSFRHLKSRKV